MQLAKISIPASGIQPFELSLDQGRSTLFIGANGAGKTRLGVFLERRIDPKRVRRIGAHRSLRMSNDLNSISLDRAMLGLETGHAGQGGNREVHRWGQQPAVTLLDDYDFLLQALFAEQNRRAVEHLQRHRLDPGAFPPETILAKLKSIWEHLLPHRKLKLLEMTVEVLPPGTSEGQGYVASQMSDGERVIFYMIGHCLMAPADAVVIIDEPELHVHKAIIGNLWDAIEAERRDCSFIYITHDLDFVSARPTASKLVVRSFTPPELWAIETLPNDTDIPERVVVELVGSRRPVLFVEGERGSLDTTIYRLVYHGYLVQPIGSCDAVIHAVSSFDRNRRLHRIGEVWGCIDSDARDQNEIESLRSKKISVLPVAEIENILLLKDVYVEIGKGLLLKDDDILIRWASFKLDILTKAKSDLEVASVRYAIRRLDAELKRLTPKAKTVVDLHSGFNMMIATVDPVSVAKEYRIMLEEAVANEDIPKVLSLYDNKGLLGIGARSLGLKNRDELSEFVGRMLGSDVGKNLLAALRKELPEITELEQQQA